MICKLEDSNVAYLILFNTYLSRKGLTAIGSADLAHAFHRSFMHVDNTFPPPKKKKKKSPHQ